MSADSTNSFFHLTPRGWQAGATGMYATEKEERANAPKDCLLSLNYYERQSSQYSSPEYDIYVVYFNMTRYADIVRAILTHGLYPDGGKNNEYMLKHYRYDEKLVNLITQCPLYRDTAKQGA